LTTTETRDTGRREEMKVAKEQKGAKPEITGGTRLSVGQTRKKRHARQEMALICLVGASSRRSCIQEEKSSSVEIVAKNTAFWGAATEKRREVGGGGGSQQLNRWRSRHSNNLTLSKPVRWRTKKEEPKKISREGVTHTFTLFGVHLGEGA